MVRPSLSRHEAREQTGHLLLENGRIAELSFRRQVPQFLVRYAPPQEIREPRRNLVVVKQPRAGIGVGLLSAEQEMRRHQHRLQRVQDRFVERLFAGARAREQRKVTIHLRGRRGPAERSRDEGFENLAGRLPRASSSRPVPRSGTSRGLADLWLRSRALAARLPDIFRRGSARGKASRRRCRNPSPPAPSAGSAWPALIWMFNRSRMVAEYSSRFSRRIGDGPGTSPPAQAASRNAPSTQPINFSRSSIPGAGLPLGGMSELRTRARTRLQVERASATCAGESYRVRSTFAAAVLPVWQATQ